MDGLFTIDDDIDLSDDDDLMQNITLPPNTTTNKDKNDVQSTTPLCRTKNKEGISSNRVSGLHEQNKSFGEPKGSCKKTFNFRSCQNFASGRKLIEGKTASPLLKDEQLGNGIDSKDKNSSKTLVASKQMNCMKSSISSEKPIPKTISSVSDAFNFDDLLDDGDDDLLSQVDLPSTFSTGALADNKQKCPDNNSYNSSGMHTSLKNVSNCDSSFSVGSNSKVNSFKSIMTSPKATNSSKAIMEKFSIDNDTVSLSRNNLRTPTIETFSPNLRPSNSLRSNNNIDRIASNSRQNTTNSNSTSRQLEKSPNNKRTSGSSRTPRQQRKFPGPAGILPTLRNFDDIDTLKSPEIPLKKSKRMPLTPKTPIEPVINLSQEEDIAASVLWQDILSYVTQHLPKLERTPMSMIINNAMCQKLTKGKVGLVAGVIKSFTISGSGGSLILRDDTQQIYGTVHCNVLEEFETLLRQGNGLILKDVSVFSPSTKKHYINITPSNIIQVFSSGCNESMSYTQSSQLLQDFVVPRPSIDKQVSSNSNDGSAKFMNDDIENFFDDDLQI